MRKPHMMHQQFFDRIDNQETTRFARMIYCVVVEIEREISTCCSEKDVEKEPFKSPLRQVKLSAWEDYAHRMGGDSRTGSTMQALYSFLEIWYVALRMVVQSWEEEEQLVLQWLIINQGFHKEGWFSPMLESSWVVDLLLSRRHKHLKSQLTILHCFYLSPAWMALNSFADVAVPSLKSSSRCCLSWWRSEREKVFHSERSYLSSRGSPLMWVFDLDHWGALPTPVQIWIDWLLSL